MIYDNKVVIGLGFGDEGKGMFTDYLCSLNKHAMVVRFNGGHQASHTVEFEGVRHSFANFGSGTFQGADTYWAKDCTVEPVGILNEMLILNEKGQYPTLYIDADCPVTTPYDIRRNRTLIRTGFHHGSSCGVGFGTTIERESKHFHLQFADLFNTKVLCSKLLEIKNFYGDADHELEWIDTCLKLIEKDEIDMAYGVWGGQLIYEGSQGLLLDQHYGFFPNVTRSNCGTTNLPQKNYEFFLITRCYQTRHGKGFMSNEDSKYILNDPLETNVTNEYQGAFRRGLLDIDLLTYAINKDPILRREATHKNLVITCLDHMNEYRCVYGGATHDFPTRQEFVNFVLTRMGYDGIQFNSVYLSMRVGEKIKVWEHIERG